MLYHRIFKFCKSNILSLPFHYFSCFCFIYLILFGQCYAQGIGNGQDGSPNISGIINAYTALIKNADQCDDTLYVQNSNDFAAGDLILIIQMQGTVIDGSETPAYGTIQDYDKAGNYEFAIVQSATDNEIILKYALLRSYAISGKTQVIKVPQYQSPAVTGMLTCQNWNGTTGGVLVFDVTGKLTMQASLNVAGKGFRGGQVLKGDHVMYIIFDYAAEPEPTDYAFKGEGIASYGIAPYISGRGAPANGGGGGNIHTTGGGGGSNYGCGGDGGWGYPVDTTGNEQLILGIGGHPLTYSNIANKIFMGGGGGAGHEHFGNGTSGANGGGIIIIMADTIDGNGNNIYALGNNSVSSGAYGDGAGGAGGGGTVLIAADQVISPLSVNVDGGSGGSSILPGFGPGGGGSGGIIWFNSSTTPDSISGLSYSGGIAGLAGGVPYGAADGCAGGVSYDLSSPFNTTIPAVTAYFSMSPTYLSFAAAAYTNSTSIKFTNLSTGGTSSLWYFGDNNTDTINSPTHTYNSLGTYIIQLVETNAMCSDTITKIITAEIDLPNAFTPNDDNVNELFPGEAANNISKITIFNRWGQIVFESDDTNISWDGTYKGINAPLGDYVYIVKYIDITGKELLQTGMLTLIR